MSALEELTGNVKTTRPRAMRPDGSLVLYFFCMAHTLLVTEHSTVNSGVTLLPLERFPSALRK